MVRHDKDRLREEHILAFNLDCKYPFGQIHRRNSRVIQLAQLLKHSAGSVSLKLSNFARLGPVFSGKVAQAFRLRVKAASRRQFRKHASGRCLNPPPRRPRYSGKANPRNGVCVNALHDRAFDRNLRWIEDGWLRHLTFNSSSHSRRRGNPCPSAFIRG